MASLEQLNQIDGRFLITIKAIQLEEGRVYDCRTIKRIYSREYGDNYLIRSQDFQMYLPRRFSSLNIEEDVPGRKFKIRGFMTNSRFPGKRTPLLQFFIDPSSQNQDANSLYQGEGISTESNRVINSTQEDELARTQTGISSPNLEDDQLSSSASSQRSASTVGMDTIDEADESLLPSTDL